MTPYLFHKSPLSRRSLTVFTRPCDSITDPVIAPRDGSRFTFSISTVVDRGRIVWFDQGRREGILLVYPSYNRGNEEDRQFK